MASETAGFGQVAGQGEDEGYADGIFEEGVFFADAVFVEHLAVVAGVDDQGVFAQSLFFEPVDDATDTVVEVGDKAVVGGDGSADHFLGQVPEFVVVDAFDDAPGFVGETDVVVGQIANVVGIVHGMKALRGAPGRMRGSVADVMRRTVPRCLCRRGIRGTHRFISVSHIWFSA